MKAKTETTGEYFGAISCLISSKAQDAKNNLKTWHHPETMTRLDLRYPMWLPLASVVTEHLKAD